MSTRTNYLNLVLPELNEFVNSWNSPVNQNMESIDDFCSDLYESLVGSSATSTWAGIRGSLGSLANRLDVSINADGSLDLTNSPDLLDIAVSSSMGAFTAPVDRLNYTDAKLYEAGLPAPYSRFAAMPASGPTAGTPHGGSSGGIPAQVRPDLDSGIALRAGHFGWSQEAASSPFAARNWEPGLVTGGGGTFITGVASGKVQLNATAAPAIFDIDGYAFRMREDLIFDYSTVVGLAFTNYVWFYVDRNESGYNDATFLYGSPAAAKDLRKLQNGSTGVTAASIFGQAGATFNAAPYRVYPGDTLVISSGTAAGDYVIKSVDSATQLTISGEFKADIANVTWEVRDNWLPNIGCSKTALATDRPPQVAGRVYIGRVEHTAGVPVPVVFAKGGTYDTGWIVPGGYPYTITHDIGGLPGSVEIWCRAGSTARAHRPLVRRSVVTALTITGIAPIAEDVQVASLLFPSLYTHANESTITLELLNSIADPVIPTAVFTTSGNVDVDAATAQVRVVVRR